MNKTKTLKICAISDMHGNYDFHIKSCDVLFICGDIVPLRMQNNIPQSIKWFKQVFIPWCEECDCDRVFFVAGNHDFFLEKAPSNINDCIDNTKIIYLFNENYVYQDKSMNEWKLFGTPLCHQFGQWAFMHSDDFNRIHYHKMDNDVDFVLTHDMPYGMNDILLQHLPWINNIKHIGNLTLREVIDEKKPKYVFGGHLHSCDHNVIDYDGTKCANVSLLDEEYNLIYEPLYLTITQNAD